MMASESSPWHSASSDSEALLQQELRALFEVDTQQNLQDYFRLLQHLSADSWTADIQHLYRAVHTIKGGAVTVEADAMLQAGIALEDLLSDLRYLEQPPDLTDGQLQQMLLEAGELLSSSLDITGTRSAAIAQVQPTVSRIQTLHELIKQRYIPNWNELKQIHQEFAEQGLDLVILDLEMALGNLDPDRPVPNATLAVAQNTLNQLASIGEDLQFGSGWSALLQDCAALVNRANGKEWQQTWPEYFHTLKSCARQGGELPLHPSEGASQEPDTLPSDAWMAAVPSMAPSPAVEPIPSLPPEADPEVLEDLFDPSFGDFMLCGGDLDLEDILEDSPSQRIEDAAGLDVLAAVDGMDLFASPTPPESQVDQLTPEPLDVAPLPFEGLDIPDLEPVWEEGMAIAELENLDLGLDLEPWEVPPTHPTVAHPDQPLPDRGLNSANDLVEPFIPQSVDKPSVPTPAPISLEGATPEIGAEVKRSIQVSVPLERLDQSAQQVVDTLLTARAVMNGAQTLQTQLAQLASFTQESAQFVTRLRQLQDDYALLRTLSDEQNSSSNVTLERYRQGYTTLNRLLENILRMSELGQEIETLTHQTTERIDRLDRSILRLKDGIESSRLVPFSGLSLRARAIVRDLSNRYGKPVELVVRGEQVELDAGMVQRLEPALLHLLRNAYDHGIEPVATRLAQGKPAQGTIRLGLQRRGNLYRLTLTDDGSGIDAEAIQRSAQAKGFALTQTRTPAELLAVLCQPGFSSRTAVSEVSGRGVGMDVVASQIADLGGKFSLETAPGKGTTFTIEVPAPQLLVPCVLMQVGDRIVAFPTDEILETVLLNSDQATPESDPQSLCAWKLQTHQGNVPGFDLGTYWLQPEQRTGVKPLSETAIALRTRQSEAETTLPHPWFMADDLLGQEELLITPLPNPLVAPAGLLGVSLQPDGRLISILDPMALATLIQTQPSAIVEPEQPTFAAQAGAAQTFKILVVDDAALMRRRLEGSLNTYGFSTVTCTDGLEAWTWLQANDLPDLIITDVEMPNMDGFTLIDRCRQSGLTVPILVVSSRLSEEWGKEARRLGASDYLNKGFSTPELVQKVNGLLKTEALASQP